MVQDGLLTDEGFSGIDGMEPVCCCCCLAIIWHPVGLSVQGRGIKGGQL